MNLRVSDAELIKAKESPYPTIFLLNESNLKQEKVKCNNSKVEVQNRKIRLMGKVFSALYFLVRGRSKSVNNITRHAGSLFLGWFLPKEKRQSKKLRSLPAAGRFGDV